MILLRKATVNQNIALKLNPTISSPTYLFEFQNDTTKDYYYVIPTITTDTSRSKIFTIEEGVNAPTVGQLVLGNTGFYHYNIYAQSSTTNLDPTLADETLSTNGKLKYIDSETSQYVQHEITQTYAVHEPTQ